MKISIITATFNSASTVADTLESILSQTYQDYEVVIKDGLSRDGTVELVKSYEEKFGGRLRIISSKDKGIYDAMNIGISAATGDVIGILNSDDFYTSTDVLSTIACAFETDPALEAVYGDVHYVSASNLAKTVRYYSSADFSPSKMRRGYMPAHPSFYVRRECYERCGKFDTSFKVAADFENLLRLIYVKGIKTKYIQKDFVTMRLGGASTSGLTSHKQIMKDHFRAFSKNGIRVSRLAYGTRYLTKLLEFVKK